MNSASKLVLNIMTHLDAWRDVISQRCCSGTRVQLRATSTMAATSSKP